MFYLKCEQIKLNPLSISIWGYQNMFYSGPEIFTWVCKVCTIWIKFITVFSKRSRHKLMYFLCRIINLHTCVYTNLSVKLLNTAFLLWLLAHQSPLVMDLLFSSRKVFLNMGFPSFDACYLNTAFISFCRFQRCHYPVLKRYWGSFRCISQYLLW